MFGVEFQLKLDTPYEMAQIKLGNRLVFPHEPINRRYQQRVNLVDTANSYQIEHTLYLFGILPAMRIKETVESSGSGVHIIGVIYPIVFMLFFYLFFPIISIALMILFVATGNLDIVLFLVMGSIGFLYVFFDRKRRIRTFIIDAIQFTLTA